MSPVQIAELQLLAQKVERQRIANNMRIALATATEGDRNPNNSAMKLWNQLADMIERGDFSK